MGLKKCGLNLNRVSKELQPHGTLDFPCAGYSALYKDRPKCAIVWHWHEEFEIVYIEAGSLKLKLPGKSFLLEKGDCVAINSNILHHATAAPQCELHSLVFHPKLITGSDDTIFAKKFILPLISSTSFDGIFLKADSFVVAFEALVSANSGYEFIVREKLSEICFILYKQLEQELKTGDVGLSQDNLRIRNMLDYMHNNFYDDIALSDIAKAADIGERECLRCFQRTIHTSPIQYLLKYRVMQCAELLLKKPANSISEIASSCGFDNPSSFAKIFKRFYSCTPREYRNLEINRECRQ